jgi:hypothetical protein
MNVQHALGMEFGNHGRKQVPTHTAVLSWVNQWHETGYIQNNKKPGRRRTVRTPATWSVSELPWREVHVNLQGDMP